MAIQIDDVIEAFMTLGKTLEGLKKDRTTDSQPRGLHGHTGQGSDRSWTTTYNFTQKTWDTKHYPGPGYVHGQLEQVIFYEDLILIREFNNSDGSIGACWFRMNGNKASGISYRASGVTNGEFDII
jgi:hypothetical protein